LVADRATRWFTNALIGDEVDRAIRHAALTAAGRAAQELLPDGQFTVDVGESGVMRIKRLAD